MTCLALNIFIISFDIPKEPRRYEYVLVNEPSVKKLHQHLNLHKYIWPKLALFLLQNLMMA